MPSSTNRTSSRTAAVGSGLARTRAKPIRVPTSPSTAAMSAPCTGTTCGSATEYLHRGEALDRSDLDRSDAHARDAFGDRARLVEVLRLDQVVTAELFLGLRE